MKHRKALRKNRNNHSEVKKIIDSMKEKHVLNKEFEKIIVTKPKKTIFLWYHKNMKKSLCRIKLYYETIFLFFLRNATALFA